MAQLLASVIALCVSFRDFRVAYRVHKRPWRVPPRLLTAILLGVRSGAC